MLKSHNCAQLAEQVGNQVTDAGWIARRRDHGGVAFFDLRDASGVIQVVVHDEQLAHSLKTESCVQVTGKIELRPAGNENTELITGGVELNAESIQIYSTAAPLPFQLDDGNEVGDEIRLKHRYLDLRRPKMAGNLILRSKANAIARDLLNKIGFIEVETPTFTRSTPEGARDYLVPSRVNPGKFFALPQSPQTYKQILMVAGMDRYFQIVKCFRDEDLRADRQPEFTQVDVEMSFVNEEDIYSLMEGLIKKTWKELVGVDVQTPFPRMTYDYAMNTYGSDKPDTRFGCEFVDFSDIVVKSEFRVFSKTVAEGGIVAGFVVPGQGVLGRGVMDRLTERAKTELGAGGLIYIKNNKDEVYSSVGKFVSDDITKEMIEKSGANEGDLILILAGKRADVLNQLGGLRLIMGHDYNLIDYSRYNFLWVTDFPLVEYSAEDGRYYAMHHPFTSPKDEDIPKMETDPLSIRARAYDLVLNGSELGGGSIRIHNRDVQSKMFRLLGIGEEEAQEKFGFLLGAFKYGAPPHGGIALGLDRLMMLITGAKSLREVIAFPKNQKAQSLMDNCPDVVEPKQLDELHIQLKPLVK